MDQSAAPLGASSASESLLEEFRSTAARLRTSSAVHVTLSSLSSRRRVPDVCAAAGSACTAGGSARIRPTETLDLYDAAAAVNVERSAGGGVGRDSDDELWSAAPLRPGGMPTSQPRRASTLPFRLEAKGRLGGEMSSVEDVEEPLVSASRFPLAASAPSDCRAPRLPRRRMTGENSSLDDESESSPSLIARRFERAYLTTSGESAASSPTSSSRSEVLCWRPRTSRGHRSHATEYWEADTPKGVAVRLVAGVVAIRWPTTESARFLGLAASCRTLRCATCRY